MYISFHTDLFYFTRIVSQWPRRAALQICSRGKQSRSEERNSLVTHPAALYRTVLENMEDRVLQLQRLAIQIFDALVLVVIEPFKSLLIDRSIHRWIDGWSFLSF